MQSPEPPARLSTDKNLVVVTGFSRPVPDAAKDIHHVRNFIEALTEKVRFASQLIVLGCPQERAKQHPNDIIDFINRTTSRPDTDQFVVGLSYGGLLALGRECKRVGHGEKLSDIVLVDAPINPDAEVVPPDDGRFDAFKYQYRNRRDTALRCGAVLSELMESELEKIITIGTVSDDIVPSEAKHLPNIDHYELPPEITGHGLTPAKIQEVVRIIVKRLRRL